MPVVKFKDENGEMKTISGEEAISLAMEQVFEEACGMTLTQLSKVVGDKTVMIDGRLHMFSIFVKTPYMKAERAKADAKNVSVRLANRTRKHGFKQCPECGVIHTSYVLWCHNPKCECDHRDRVPQEDNDEVREYVLRPMPVLGDEDDMGEADKDQAPMNPMDEMVMEEGETPERNNVKED